MHLDFLAASWWAVLAAMLAILATLVLVAGRSAQGGFKKRTRLGWRRWRALSRRGADLQARLLLTVVYFTVVLPFGLVRTCLADPLRLRRASQGRSWLERQTRDLTLEDARRQF